MAKIVTDSDIGTGLEIVAGKLKTNLTKSDLGLGNVNNTSDVDKPVSTATASAIATSVNGLIEDALVDGITTKAPSQNAVFDALATKEPALGYTAANNNNVVHISGSETVTGNKTFSGTTKFDGDYTQFETGSFFVKQTGLASYNVVEGVDGGFDFYNNAGTSFNFKMRPTLFSFGEIGKQATLNTSNLTSARAFDLPNSSGTIALTSDLTSKISGSLTTNYLPKATGSTTLGNSLIYDNGTNVGIGTTSPSGLLHLSGNSNSPITHIIENNNAGTSAGTRISFRYQGTETCYIYNKFNGVDYNTDIASSDYLRILTGSNERLRINNIGNVGIGTTTPTGILDVASTTSGSLPFPRMTSAQRTDISSPANGTHVYQTDGIEGVYVKKSTGWVFAY